MKKNFLMSPTFILGASLAVFSYGEQAVADDKDNEAKSTGVASASPRRAEGDVAAAHAGFVESRQQLDLLREARAADRAALLALQEEHARREAERKQPMHAASLKEAENLVTLLQDRIAAFKKQELELEQYPENTDSQRHLGNLRAKIQDFETVLGAEEERVRNGKALSELEIKVKTEKEAMETLKASMPELLQSLPSLSPEERKSKFDALRLVTERLNSRTSALENAENTLTMQVHMSRADAALRDRVLNEIAPQGESAAAGPAPAE